MTLSIVAERLAKRTRVEYLRAVLKQEVSWFEENDKIVELPAKLN